MKKLLILALIFISIGVNAQYSKQYKPHEVNKYGFIAANTVILTGFTLNETIICNPSLTAAQKYSKTSKIYGLTVVSSIGSYYLIKWINETKPFKRKKCSRKYKY